MGQKYVVLRDNGQVVTGTLAAADKNKVSIRDKNGGLEKIKRETIESMKRVKIRE